MHHQQTTNSSVFTKFLPENGKTYIHHPKHGLLQRICKVDHNQDLFAAIYVKNLFFLVTAKDMDTKYEPLGSKEAKELIEELE